MKKQYLLMLCISFFSSFALGMDNNIINADNMGLALISRLSFNRVSDDLPDNIKSAFKLERFARITFFGKVTKSSPPIEKIVKINKELIHVYLYSKIVYEVRIENLITESKLKDLVKFINTEKNNREYALFQRVDFTRFKELKNTILTKEQLSKTWKIIDSKELGKHNLFKDIKQLKNGEIYNLPIPKENLEIISSYIYRNDWPAIVPLMYEGIG